MSADIALGNLVLEKYSQLAFILEDLIRACRLGDCPEQNALLSQIKQQTNHEGIHYTQDELTYIFLGRGSQDGP